MANTNRPNGFVPVAFNNSSEIIAHAWPVAASQTIAAGDLLYLDSAGRAAIATATTAGNFLGVSAQASASQAVGTEILVYDDPNQVYHAQSISGALADPYTTASAAACFDIVATTGAMYINSAASSYNVIKVLGPAFDPATGEKSAVGSYQRQFCKINPALHVFGTTA